MNCDRIAGVYRWLEYAAFQKALERCRTHFLTSIESRQRALLIGDGDGRFLESYLRANPDSCVNSIDISRQMQHLAARRATAVPGGLRRVRFINSDARTFQPRETYDLIVTHFFLDCLEEGEIDALAVCLCGAMQPNTLWLVSEFRVPDGTISRPLGFALIRVMYGFFALTTGLERRCLPGYRGVLRRRGFQLLHEHPHLGGLLVSEIWECGQHVVPSLPNRDP